MSNDEFKKYWQLFIVFYIFNGPYINYPSKTFYAGKPIIFGCVPTLYNLNMFTVYKKMVQKKQNKNMIKDIKIIDIKIIGGKETILKENKNNEAEKNKDKENEEETNDVKKYIELITYKKKEILEMEKIKEKK